MASNFRSDWNAAFGNAPPLSFRLWDEFHDRWFRIHSLPESKRYAETEEEYEILLSRAESQGNDILGVGEPCWLIAAYATPIDDDIVGLSPDWFFAHEAFDLQHKFDCIDPTEAPEDQRPWQVFATKTEWDFPRFRELLIKCADEIVFSNFWFSPSRKRLFMPYDGGIDIVLTNASEVPAYVSRYREWMSARGDWL